MRLLVAFLYETILRSDLCDFKLYMADPTAARLEGFGILFIPLSANFSWMLHTTPGSMQLDGGDVTKIHTYLCEDVNGICQLLHY